MPRLVKSGQKQNILPNVDFLLNFESKVNLLLYFIIINICAVFRQLFLLYSHLSGGSSEYLTVVISLMYFIFDFLVCDKPFMLSKPFLNPYWQLYTQ